MSDEQAALQAALDAALDELSDDDEDDEEEEELKPPAFAPAPAPTPPVVVKNEPTPPPPSTPPPPPPPPPTPVLLPVAPPPDTRPFQGPPLPPEMGLDASDDDTPIRPVHHPPAPPSVPERLLVDLMNDMLLEEQEGVEDPEQMMERLLEKMQAQLAVNPQQAAHETARSAADARVPEPAPVTPAPTPTPSVASKPKTKPPPATDQKQQVDDAIAKLLHDMAQPCADDDDDVDDDLLQKLLNGGDFNADAMMDGMMEQLLSKELMYEPMKQVASKFPQWLADQKGVLPEKDYQDRVQQNECFQKLVQAYESNADAQQLMLLMEQVQEYGQPPAEIIREIAPGLELDANGLPKFDGVEGMPPFPQGEDCRIM